MEVLTGLVWSVLGAALAVGLPCAGSAIGISLAGQAGSGVISEDPEKFGRLLILVIMPGTQGIYGFLGMFWAIMKVGLMGTPVEVSADKGIMIFLSCLPIAIAGLISAIHQGKAAASAIGLVAKRPEEMGKGLIFVAMVETYAVIALLATILMINAVSI